MGLDTCKNLKLRIAVAHELRVNRTPVQGATLPEQTILVTLR